VTANVAAASVPQKKPNLASRIALLKATAIEKQRYANQAKRQKTNRHNTEDDPSTPVESILPT
jgi:hypothetical protein